jgi:hypothetical protein
VQRLSEVTFIFKHVLKHDSVVLKSRAVEFCAVASNICECFVSHGRGRENFKVAVGFL